VSSTHTKSFDRVAHCYDATRAMPDAAHADVTAGLVRALRATSPAPRLLEVGIGTGRIAVPLARSGVEVVGIDVAPAMLAQLRARRPELAVLLAEASRPPFRAATFDAVLFVHVLHLLPDSETALRAAREVLRPRGMLLYGREERSASPLRGVSALVRRIVSEISGVPFSAPAWNERDVAAFLAHARAEGSEPVESVLARWREHTTGRQLLDHIAGRVWSSTWDIPDAVMPELLCRLAPRVEALLGGLDRPVEWESNFVLLTTPTGPRVDRKPGMR
jgi:ubiquinone/menaquinone biosynthesis C-methylase UbiE